MSQIPHLKSDINNKSYHETSHATKITFKSIMKIKITPWRVITISFYDYYEIWFSTRPLIFLTSVTKRESFIFICHLKGFVTFFGLKFLCLIKLNLNFKTTYSVSLCRLLLWKPINSIINIVFFAVELNLHYSITSSIPRFHCVLRGRYYFVSPYPVRI